MNKLEMAHEYTKIMLKCAVENGSMYKEDTTMVVNSIIQSSFNLAEAMHEENNKRYKLEINKILKDHEHVFIEGLICWCGKTKSDFEGEWQPDWSQAPEWANWWALDLDNLQAHWYEVKPTLDAITWHRSTRTCKQASTFGYIGKWQDSLRKRP